MNQKRKKFEKKKERERSVRKKILYRRVKKREEARGVSLLQKEEKESQKVSPECQKLLDDLVERKISE